MNASTNPDTDQLLQSAAAGDEQAVDQLLGRHRGRLRSLVAVRMDSRLATRVDHSDVLQDVLVTAHKRLDDYLRDRPIAFYPWLRQLAIDRLTDLYRFHVGVGRRTVDREEALSMGISDRSAAQLADQLVDQQSSPSRRIIRAELKDRVMRALEQMPRDQREIIVMRHLEELPLKEIATILGVSIGTVSSRHFRGMRTLRRILDD